MQRALSGDDAMGCSVSRAVAERCSGAIDSISSMAIRLSAAGISHRSDPRRYMVEVLRQQSGHSGALSAKLSVIRSTVDD